MVRNILCTLAALAAAAFYISLIPDAFRREREGIERHEAMLCIRGGDWNDADPFCYDISKRGRR